MERVNFHVIEKKWQKKWLKKKTIKILKKNFTV